MKKSFKLKALVFVMLLTMVVSMFPSVMATPKHDNKVTAPGGKNNAQFVFSLNANKTSLKPGEEFTVTLTADRMPQFGMSALSFEMDYDNRQIEVVTEPDKYGRPMPKMDLGPVGTAMNLSSLKETTDDDDENLNRIKTGNGVGAELAVDKLGVVLTAHFRVKDNASGNIRIYMAEGANGTTSNGFKPSGVKLEDGNNPVSDTSMSYWLDTNLDSLFVDVPATGITYTGPQTVNLDTKTQSTMSLVDFVHPDPTNTSDTIRWKSSNESVVKVENGILTAAGQGSAVVTATVGDYSVDIPVQVVVALEGVRFDVENVDLDLTTGTTKNIKGNVKPVPAIAILGNITFTSSNTDVVTVDANGNVTPVGKGDAKITVTCGEFTAEVPVHVGATISNIEFTRNTLGLDTKDNKTYDLNSILTTAPENADDYTASWSSSNSDVASVDQNGVVTAKKNGTTTITVTKGGKTANITVTVTVPLEEITLSKDSVVVYKGDSNTEVTVTAGPEGAAWTDLEAVVDNDNATASVNNNGVVTITGVTEGNAVVTVAANSANSGNMVKDINVEVRENKITAVTVTPANNNDLYIKETKQFNKEFTSSRPLSEHAITDSQVVTWSTSDETVATVDQNGVVTGVKAGEVNVIATTQTGIVGQYKLTVKENKITGITVTNTEKEVFKNNTLRLNVKYSSEVEESVHAITDDKTLSFVSDNTAVATVDNNGVVTGVKEGTANITVSVPNGKTATFAVKVNENKITDIAVAPVEDKDLYKNDTLRLKVDFTSQFEESVHPITDDKTLTYVSDKTSVATVDNNGVVTGVAKGNATITVSIPNGKTATYTVEVKENNITGLKVTPAEAKDLYKNETLKLNVAYDSTVAESVHAITDNKTLSFVSDNTAVATVDNNGVVTGIKEGTANITVSVPNGVKATYVVEVKENKVTGVEIKADTTDLVKGFTTTLKADIKSTVATSVHPITDDTKATWSSDDEDIATVDQNGVVTALKEGTANITVIVAGKSNTIEINVTEIHAEKIVITKDQLDAFKEAEKVVGSEISVEFVLDPTDSTDDLTNLKDLIKADYDESKVNFTMTYDAETGVGKIVVKFLEAGDTTLTIDYEGAETEDGEHAYVFEMNIKEPSVPSEEGENSDTSDMPVVLMTVVMIISLAGVVVTKRKLVK